MDEDRLILHNRLASLFPSYKLYFRPPSKLILEYPCIVYDFTNMPSTYSNNGPYIVSSSFKVTLMTRLPGEKRVKEVLTIRGSKHNTSFVSSDIVHDVFTITIN